MNSSKCGNPAIPEVCCVLSSLLSWTWNSYQNNSNIHHRPEDLSIRLLEKVCSIASQNTVGTPLKFTERVDVHVYYSSCRVCCKGEMHTSDHAKNPIRVQEIQLYWLSKRIVVGASAVLGGSGALSACHASGWFCGSSQKRNANVLSRGLCSLSGGISCCRTTQLQCRTGC